MKKKIAVFDIDGTLFRNSLLLELHWELVKEGVFSKRVLGELDRLYWSWVTRKGSYETYLTEAIKLFDRQIKGITPQAIRSAARIVARRQNSIVYRFTRDLIIKLRKTHILIAISGSPIEAVREFLRYWKFEYMFGTVHEIRGNKYTGKKLFVPAIAKGKHLYAFCKAENISLSGSIGVGDTEGDLGIFELVSKAICFNPNLTLYRIARKRGYRIVVERKNVIYHL